jgi:ATP-dependent Clp protease ATP-binding subunit ClpC
MGFAFTSDEVRAQERRYDDMRAKVTEELKRTFRPEFLNRIDAIIVFHSLNNDHIRQMVDLQLKRIRVQLAEQDIELDVTSEAMDLLARRGYDPQYGARPLRRIITNLIEDPLAEGLLDARFVPGKRIRVDVEDDLLKLTQEDRASVEEGELAAAGAET